MSFWKFFWGYYIFDAIFGGHRRCNCDINSMINPFPPNYNNPSGPGYNQGYNSGFNNGYNCGYNDGHNNGYNFGDGYDWHNSLGSGHNYGGGYDWHDSLGSGHNCGYNGGGFGWGAGGYPPPYNPCDPFDDDDDF